MAHLATYRNDTKLLCDHPEHLFTALDKGPMVRVELSRLGLVWVALIAVIGADPCSHRPYGTYALLDRTLFYKWPDLYIVP